MAEQAKAGMNAGMAMDMSMQIKEGKGASTFGKLRSIVDFTKGEVMLIDPDKKRIVTLKPEQMADEFSKIMAEMPAEAKAAMASMKASAETKVTGRKDKVQGIEVEERELTMSIEGPAMPNMPPGPMIKMAMSLWSATSGEILRVPALRELTAHNLWGYATMNPAGMMEKMFQQMPGMADGFGKMIKEMQAAKAMMLRTDIKLWMPALAAAMKQVPPEKNPFGPNFDFESPFLEIVQEAAELSTAAIPASVFAVPQGYQEVSAAELIREMMPKGQNQAK
jgi:hypothetical protein